MLLEFSIKNYRSLKDKASFSFIAESSKSKPENVFKRKLSNGDEIRLLKTAVLYGANASGKSNILKGLFFFFKFIQKSEINAGENIPFYDPYLFDVDSRKKPTEYNLTFLDDAGIKYTYEVHFDRKSVIKEELYYWPNGKSTLLLKRLVEKNEDSGSIHNVQIGSESKKKLIKVFNNRLALEIFGSEKADEKITNVYVLLRKIQIINPVNLPVLLNGARNDVTKLLIEYPQIKNKINCLIKFADTKIENISIIQRDEKDFQFPKDFSEQDKMQIINNNRYLILGNHNIYDKKKVIGSIGLTLDEESQGTHSLYCLGGIILATLEFGGVLIVDELNTSLHPYLSKLLILLFQNKKLNSKNAQLLFTTHDTNLLDRTLFRKDQVWFTEKDNYGETTLYSLQDFDDVREDTPFDKWYMAGKLGALPEIGSLEKLCNETSKNAH